MKIYITEFKSEILNQGLHRRSITAASKLYLLCSGIHFFVCLSVLHFDDEKLLILLVEIKRYSTRDLRERSQYHRYTVISAIFLRSRDLSSIFYTAYTSPRKVETFYVYVSMINVQVLEFFSTSTQSPFWVYFASVRYSRICYFLL